MAHFTGVQAAGAQGQCRKLPGYVVPIFSPNLEQAGKDSFQPPIDAGLRIRRFLQIRVLSSLHALFGKGSPSFCDITGRIALYNSGHHAPKLFLCNTPSRNSGLAGISNVPGRHISHIAPYPAFGPAFTDQGSHSPIISGSHQSAGHTAGAPIRKCHPFSLRHICIPPICCSTPSDCSSPISFCSSDRISSLLPRSEPPQLV